MQQGSSGHFLRLQDYTTPARNLTVFMSLRFVHAGLLLTTSNTRISENCRERCVLPAVQGRQSTEDWHSSVSARTHEDRRDVFGQAGYLFLDEALGGIRRRNQRRLHRSPGARFKYFCWRLSDQELAAHFDTLLDKNPIQTGQINRVRVIIADDPPHTTRHAGPLRRFQRRWANRFRHGPLALATASMTNRLTAWHSCSCSKTGQATT